MTGSVLMPFPSPPARRVDVLRVGMSAVDMEEALARTEALLRADGKGYICVTGVHGIMEAQQDAKLLDTLNQAFLCLPDGMPTVWVGRAYGHRSMARVYGPDFMMALCRRSVLGGYRHFLYGGQDGVADDLAQVLADRCPGLQVVGTYTPPFRPLSEEELGALQEQVRAARADILWVGLSTPKQERFMREHLARLDVKVMAGVGAAFDIHTGRVKDAPEWIKRAGLQWLHRLCQEPRRLARRYLVNNPVFVAKIGMQLLSDSLAERFRPGP